MGCICKKSSDNTESSSNNAMPAYAFIVLILFILLAIIWGSSIN